MNPEELENALATTAIVNKFLNNGNGSAEHIHIDDFKNKISRIEQMLSKYICTTATLRTDIDNLLISKNLINDEVRMKLDKLELTVTQLYANQAVLMDWVKATTHAEKEKLRLELSDKKKDNTKELAHKVLAKKADKTLKPKVSKELHKKLQKVKKWLEGMFATQKKIFATDLMEHARIEGIDWSHVHLVKNNYMNGKVKLHKIGGGAKQKWLWTLMEAE